MKVHLVCRGTISLGETEDVSINLSEDIYLSFIYYIYKMMRLFILVTLWVGSEETRERRSPKSQIEKGGSITLMNKCYLDGMVVWDYYKDKNLYESGKCICYAHSNNNHIVDMTNRCIE
jgi:hypothetical protein